MQHHPWQWSARFISKEYRLAAKFVRNSKNHKIGLAVSLLVTTVGFVALSSQTSAKSPSEEVVQRVNVGLTQCATIPETCTTTDSAQWQSGNLNQNNSSYYEGQSVPYRAAFTDLTVGQVYKLVIGWDATKGGLQAHDYLTSFDRSIATAIPCDTATCGNAAPATLAIPLDTTLSSITQIPGVFTAYGATFTPLATIIPSGTIGNLCNVYPCAITANPTGYTPSGLRTGDSSNEISVYFTATNTTAVIAWGGHIASSVDWGPDSSASSISGSPYHMRLNELFCQNDNCSSGNLDRSMSATAAPSVTTLPAVTTTTELVTTTTTPPETTTTTPSGPTTTLPTTTLPTTTLPTTTLPTTTLPITTTVVPTTIAVATTVVSATTAAPGTTVPGTASTVNVSTTGDPNLQVQFPDLGNPSDPDFLVQFPEDLPSTGTWFNLVFILQLIVLLIATGIVFLTGVIVQHRYFVRA